MIGSSRASNSPRSRAARKRRHSALSASVVCAWMMMLVSSRPTGLLFSHCIACCYVLPFLAELLPIDGFVDVVPLERFCKSHAMVNVQLNFAGFGNCECDEIARL